ncbi:hypothetical protein Tco_0523026 [Tanacetum coccineum]
MEVNREGYSVDAAEPGAFVAISMACSQRRPQESILENLAKYHRTHMVPLEDPSVFKGTIPKGRKAHLLEDKQIPSVGVFDEVFLALGWHLEEIHVTWAHLEKKRTRLRLYTKNHEELFTQSLETASQP